MRRCLLIPVLLLFVFIVNGHAEDIIWRNAPTSAMKTPDRVVASTLTGQLGPGSNISATYALAQVFVDPDQCDDAQPGVINQITTYFEDDGVSFGKVDGMARLNIFVVPGANVLPLTDDNPDFGLDVPVTFTQTNVGGMDVITVQANGLANLGQPIVIHTGVYYYIGLTPILPKNDLLFEGDHLANVVPKDAESASAVRTTAPPPDTDWDFAEDADSGDQLFATIEIRGFTTPNVYLSSLGFGESASPGYEVINVGSGSTATFNVWVDATLAADMTLGLDVSLQTSGIAQFTDSEVFEATIEVAGMPVDVRWGQVNPGMIAPAGQFISSMAGFSFKNGTGIVPENTGPVFLDTLYDPTADAFLFGRINVTVLAMGTTQVTLAESPLGIVHSGPTAVPVFGDLLICNVVAGDVSGDGVLNLLDVGPFVDLLSGGGYNAAADINKDGCVNLLDVGPFVDLLAAGK